MLTKPPVITNIPETPEQLFLAASTVCTPIPPKPDNPPPITPVVPPTTTGTTVAYYVYVPSNPAVFVSEKRTAFAAHPGTGYTCDASPQRYFITTVSNGVPYTQPVYERRCNWTYP